ncbi:MAG: MFS transporter [Myxococcales bacterium]|nr:MFS transporter [Myxococcales bacterium]
MVRFIQYMKRSLAVYTDRRMLILLGIGFSSGLPIMLVFSTLSLWMLELGISLKTIGVASTVLLPYKLKFLWAPLVDRLPIPIFGLRRGWLILTQLALIGAIIALGMTDPQNDLMHCIFWATTLAVISATHDIIVDGYRVELLEPNEQGAGSAVAVLGYRMGMIVSGAGALYFAHYFGSVGGFCTQADDYTSPFGWNAAYLVMVLFLLPSLAASLYAKEPAGSGEHLGKRDDEAIRGFLWRSFVEGAILPYVEMLRRHGSILFITFIMLFTLGEALLSTMTNPFMREIGFSKLEIANVVKSFGIAATIAGIFVGGSMVKSLGVIRALWLGGLGQMFLNLAFSAQALIGDNIWVLIVTIFLEKFTVGIAAAAFVAYLSALCSRAYGATHYAMLMSASGLVKVGLAAFAGHAVEYFKTLAAALPLESLGTPTAIGWAFYFCATTLIAGPGMILLYYLNRWNMTGLTGEADSGQSSSR